ncbi:beta-ketoacyl synthase N-terminal-like domain-containing protein, partial [Streptomyces sp. NPDC094038]|uniref:beta-ketoacyl synthase N-terminal-like domain-containing protein n=1 Tax=Streptomyces sp. NPDC094038 TaxID=3366055 RepID=UPI0038221776
MSIDQVVEALKVSLAERDALRLQNAELLDARTDPVAIVGMACRYPGGVSSAQELWDLIVSGRDSVGPFPLDRGWPGEFEGSFPRVGGFLYGAAEFDA